MHIYLYNSERKFIFEQLGVLWHNVKRTQYERIFCGKVLRYSKIKAIWKQA